MDVTNLLDHTFPHIIENCPGHFELMTMPNQIYLYSNSLPAEILPEADYVTCQACQVSFYAPGFEQRIERLKVEALMGHDRLAPHEVRFIRIACDLTRAQLAVVIGLTESDVTKIEATIGLDQGPEFEALGRLICALS